MLYQKLLAALHLLFVLQGCVAMVAYWTLLVTVVSALIVAPAASTEIPLAAFLNFTNRNQLVSCGSTLAWVETTSGQSNVLASTRPHSSGDFSVGFAVTSSTSEDGMIIEDLQRP